MAESVEDELRRKLEDAVNEINEVNGHIARYTSKIAILEKRCDDLKKALSAFSFEVVPAPSYDGYYGYNDSELDDEFHRAPF